MKIKVLLLAGFISLTVLVLLVGLLGIRALENSSQLYEDLGKDFGPFTKASLDITRYSKRAEISIMLYLMLGDEHDKESFDESIVLLHDALSEVQKYGDDDEAIRRLLSRVADIEKDGVLLVSRYQQESRFSFRDNQELLRSFHDSTSEVRSMAVELSKIHRERFLNQLATNTNIDIVSYSKRAEGHLMMYLMLGNPVDREKFFQRIDSLNFNIGLMKSAVYEGAEEELISKMESASDNLLNYGNLLLEEYDKNPTDFNVKEHEYLLKAFHYSAQEVRLSGTEIGDKRIGELIAVDRSIEMNKQSLRNSMIIILIISFALAFLLTIYVSNAISGPINELSEVVGKTSKGRNRTRLESKHILIDEIRYLYEALGRILVTMRLGIRRLKESKEKSELKKGRRKKKKFDL